MPHHRRVKPHISSTVIPQITSEPSQRYIQYKIKQWLCRALMAKAQVDSSFFECLAYAQNGLDGIAKALRGVLSENSTYKVLSARKRQELVEELKTTNARRYDSLLEDIWQEHTVLHPILQDIILSSCALSKKVSMPREVQRIRKNITAFLGCSSAMLDFLEFVYAIRNISQVEHYFEDALAVYKKAHLPMLAKVLDMPSATLRDIVTEAERCGFTDDDFNQCFTLTPLMDKLWSTEGNASMEDMLYVPLKGKALPLENYHLPADTVSHVTRLMALQSDEPMHILLYGAPGTGKTSFAHSLAHELGVKAWAVASGIDDGESNRRTSLLACTRIAAQNEGAFVLVDEAERLLDTDFRGRHKSKDKAWLNASLEHKGRRVIWITNHISHIDDAVRRRFAYSIHFEALTVEQRCHAWEQIIKDAKVISRITQDEIQSLVRQYAVPVAVVAKAVHQAKLMQEPKGAFAKTVERILEAHITLEHNGHKQKKQMTRDEAYTLDGVTLEQGREHNVTNIMKKVRKIDAILKEGSLPKGGGTMLFYGPPGTGKSALAQYMAQELGRECVIKKASDLLSMYVGEAEKNIAAAFAEAEANGYILVIDEADSFMYSRESATRSWEVTQVNEFLTQLEAFKGICICTSNRRTSMDAAAMRRFSFKIPFAYAGAEQVEKLYASILAPLCGQELTEKQRKALLSCKSLAPGDFAAVRSQFWLDDDINHTKLIEALIREQKSKLDSVSKVMGFK